MLACGWRQAESPLVSQNDTQRELSTLIFALGGGHDSSELSNRKNYLRIARKEKNKNVSLHYQIRSEDDF